MGCFNTVVLNSPVDAVWSALRNFHWASDWSSENGEGGSVAEFRDPIYQGLLQDMKSHFG